MVTRLVTAPNGWTVHVQGSYKSRYVAGMEVKVDKVIEYPMDWSIRKVVRYIAISMVDNGYASKKEAGDWMIGKHKPGTYEGFLGISYTIAPKP